MLALLAKEPSHGYELRARLGHALGPLGDVLNAGQIYVTLRRLEKAGLVPASARPVWQTVQTARSTSLLRLASNEWPTGSPR